LGGKRTTSRHRAGGDTGPNYSFFRGTPPNRDAAGEPTMD
jgi:hypothetical protein